MIRRGALLAGRDLLVLAVAALVRHARAERERVRSRATSAGARAAGQVGELAGIAAAGRQDVQLRLALGLAAQERDPGAVGGVARRVVADAVGELSWLAGAVEVDEPQRAAVLVLVQVGSRRCDDGGAAVRRDGGGAEGDEVGDVGGLHSLTPRFRQVGLVDELSARVRARSLSAQRRVLIGIAGPPGSGKTTLAEAVVARLGGFPDVAYVPMDGFHLADVELDPARPRRPQGRPGHLRPARLCGVLERIAAGEDVWAPAFERVLEQPIAQAIPIVAQTRIVVTEGNYLLLPDPPWPAVRAQLDEVWFCRQIESVRHARLVARHVQFGKTPDEAMAWVQRSDERNAALVAATQDDADLIVDLAGIDLIAGMSQALASAGGGTIATTGAGAGGTIRRPCRRRS